MVRNWKQEEIQFIKDNIDLMPGRNFGTLFGPPLDWIFGTLFKTKNTNKK